MADTATLPRPVQPTWSRRYPAGAPRRTDLPNVGDTERWLSLLGGGALAVFGLTRGSAAGLGLAAAGGALVYRGLSGHCPMYGALGLNTAERHGRATSVPARSGSKVERSVTISRSPEELYRFWRNLENLPRFMRHLKSVEHRGHKQSHWVAQGPMGMSASWDAEIITERENELIGWRSLPGSMVDTAGSVHFQKAPGERGTEVRVSLKYNPPGGKVGAGLAWLFGESAEQQVKDDLYRLKQIMEAGEVATTQGQPRGHC